MALSGVNLAFWNLLGHSENKPVCQLIGPLLKPVVRAYATGPDPHWYYDQGFTAHKFFQTWTGHESDYDRAIVSASTWREISSPDSLIMVDGYMSWTVEMAKEMGKRLSAFDIYWFEDVLSPDDMDGQAALRMLLKPVLIAGGEHEFTYHGFSEIAQKGALDLWQPDVTWCGGITEVLRIIELATQFGVGVVLHRGGEVWGLHVIAATTCHDMDEVVLGKRGDLQD